MIWHVVKIDFKPDVALPERDKAEQLLASHLDSSRFVRFWRIGRSIRDEGSSLVMSGFASRDDLDAYYDDPRHAEVHAVIRELKLGGPGAIDIETDDVADSLPRSLIGR